ncbi:MAG: kelch repeat-containing protein [Phycisphaerales bacterium]
MKNTSSWNTIAGLLGLSVGFALVPAALAQPCAPSGWTQTLAEAGVPARSTTAIAQAAGNTLVLFGGYGSGTEYGDTWVFDGAAWSKRNVAGPSARSQHVMTYDASRQRTVLFGGQGFGEATETWEWDGAAWTQDSPANSPPAILGAALGYDGVNGRVILVGGTFAENGQPNPDCWSFNGTTWTNLGSLNGPALRSYAATTYDSARGRLVLFGGVSTSTFEDLSETWEFDGTQWEPVAFGPVSFSGLRPSLAFDSVRARLVLSGAFNNPSGTYEFDGLDWVEVASTTPGAGLPVAYSAAAGHVVQLQAAPSQTWSWDGAAWTRLGPISIPALNGHSLTYNAATGKAMLFGGTTFLGNTSGDLWSFEGTHWALVSSDGPSPRDRAGLVYDSQRGGLVLFGGYDNNFGGQGDTWTWTGAWTQLDIPGPPGRSGGAMAYDAARNQTVLFGGLDADFNRIGDTWVLQGSTWSQVATATGPAGRDRASMAYDPSRGKVVLFGGRDENFSIGNDTWEFDGTTWNQVASAGRPPARYAASLSYDASVGKLVLIGGLDENFVSLDDAWVLDQVNGWQRIVSPNGLGPRTDHAATYVPSLGRTLLYGGATTTPTPGATRGSLRRVSWPT